MLPRILSQLISKNDLLSEKKLLLSGDMAFIPGPVETGEIPIVLTFRRRFMSSSSTYLLLSFFDAVIILVYCWLLTECKRTTNLGEFLQNPQDTYHLPGLQVDLKIKNKTLLVTNPVMEIFPQ